MPLTLPNLDDRTYADLLAEARALIPALAPDWTDHNPADPGITLVELFAWLTEMLLYRVNEVTDEHRLAFLRLINGPEWHRSANKSVAEEVRATVLALRQPGRAVTADDFERLARKVPGVARAHCLPRRNLELADRNKRNGDAPADVSVVIVPDGGDAKLTIAAVHTALDHARLLTTRLHVVAARPVSIDVTLTIHGRDDAEEKHLLEQAEEALETFFDPRAGGPDGRGWPLGRSIYISEIYDLLARQQGVDYVSPTGNEPELAANPDAAWRRRTLKDNELAAIALDPDELPRLQISAGKLSVKLPERA